MNRRRPWITWVSVLLSVIVHGLVLAPLVDLPITRPGNEVFGRSLVEEPYAPIERAEDLIIDDGTAADSTVSGPLDDPTSALATEQANQLKQEADRVLDQFDPESFADAGRTQTPEPIDLDSVVESVAVDDPVAIADAAVDRADLRLLAAAEPAITLPEFRAPTDEVDAPTPTTEPIAPAEMADLTNIGPTPRAAGGPGGPGGGGDGNAAVGGQAGAPGQPVVVIPQLDLDLQPPAAAPIIDVKPIDITIVPTGDPLEPPKRLDDDFDYQLLTYHGPPREVGGIRLFGSGPQTPADGWFEVRIAARPTLRKLQSLNKDVVYVIDTSGSIKDQWLAPIRKGVVAALGSLNEGDRFNIIRFEETVAIMSSAGLLDATEAQISAAETFINSTREGGSTDVDRALASLVRRKVDDDRVYQVIFISDGKPTQGAIDASTIINAFTRDNRMVAAIYFVAVGRSINRPLVDSLAYRNKGYVIRPDEPADAANDIRDLASRLRYPILRDATFSIAGVERSAVFPRHLRDVYQGDPVRLFGRFTPPGNRVAGEIVGRNRGKRMAFRFNLPFTSAGPGELPIATAWAREKVAHLTSEMLRQEGARAKQTQADIAELQKQYDLEKD